jgi:hypothetical protein
MAQLRKQVIKRGWQGKSKNPRSRTREEKIKAAPLSVL